jgi:4,5-dihydroxyphthalate decarboxylase
MAVIRRSIAESRPEVVRELYRVLRESRAVAALPAGVDDPLRFGIGATCRSLEQMVAYAIDQGLISRRPTAEELFADALRILGPAAE